MKILLVYPDVNVRGGARSFQFGIGLMSAVLKTHGHQTRLHYLFGKYDSAALGKTIADWQPDLIAFSAVSPQYHYVQRLFRDLQPFNAFTILGGQHATLVPECLEEIDGLNAVCIGEGEYPLLELADSLAARDARPAGGKIDYTVKNIWFKTGQNRIIRNETRPFIEDLDVLPFADRGLFDYQRIIDSDFSTALFMFSRGCPYDCTFCSNHALRIKQPGRYVRFRSVKSALDEIRQVTSRYRMQTLYFNDDCFTAQKAFFEEFCGCYPREFSFPFDINARPETLNDEVCRQLQKAGCRRVSIGIENGSEKFRREVLGRKQSNDQIAEAFAACRKAGLKTKSFNIVGFPYETSAVFQETVNLNRRIQPDSVIIGVFEPYPGTKLSEVCLQEGFISANSADTCFVGRRDTVLNMPQFPRKEILKCFRNFAYNVYRQNAPFKALFYRAYYSLLGETVIRFLSPLKAFIRRYVMGV
ncbi:MAG: radical SAM protein [Kiritimatiellia bacterium]|nr:radical SAM protein [Kiritimatiellia bacterium]